MADPVVLVEKKDEERIWVITMNRPERRNALGGGMIPELNRIWQEFRDTKQARVAILTGSGTVFSAGADLKEMREK